MLHADGWTDRRTDMDKLIVALADFANAPRNVVFHTKYNYTTIQRYST